MEVFKNMSKENKVNLLRLLFFTIISFILYRYYSHVGKKFFIVMGFLIVYLLLGGEIFQRGIYSITHGNSMDENFLITIATFIAFLLGQYEEALAVLIFYSFGEVFEDIATDKSRDNIKSLMDIVPQKAQKVNPDGTFTEVDIEDIEIGDIILASDGEKIAVDGIVIDGEGLLDTSSLTGESLPKSIKSGSKILSSSILSSGIIRYRASKVFDDSIANKIIELIEESNERKSDSERLITRFAKIYTPIVVALATFIAIVPPLLGFGLREYLLRAGTFLIIACPCALVISIPLTYISGLGLASKNKILLKGSNFFEKIMDSDTLFTDKTGTLTKGEFDIETIVYYTDYSKNLILDYIYNLEKLSNHPIAKSIVNSLNRNDNPSYFIASKNIIGMGVWARTYENNEIKIGSADFVGEVDNTNGKAVYMTINNLLVCKIILQDKLKDDAKETIDDIRENFNQIAVLSGDDEKAVIEVAKELGIGYCAKLLPDEKLELLRDEQKKGHSVIYLGDGINDGPILKSADVGISMGQTASDLAIEASDILIVNGEVSKIKDLIKISKIVDKTAKENLSFILLAKIIILILGLFGYAPMWLAVFGDVGVSIIATLWAMRILNKKI
ncbi:heavy metal translocating P-type ATPase [Anaerococcus porci]|uniref:heavy metal translocating P-type ATPase n=1 Tax=Anaerococcus porci TaxID=2652269 RepID=UPI002A760877|nr:heavy metal translocating P-type ATPase [Anaerococcus porci]MDY3006523.1 heavy metal translocating P-type ATPase [Anaerococcus porci]